MAKTLKHGQENESRKTSLYGTPSEPHFLDKPYTTLSRLILQENGRNVISIVLITHCFHQVNPASAYIRE